MDSQTCVWVCDFGNTSDALGSNEEKAGLENIFKKKVYTIITFFGDN